MSIKLKPYSALCYHGTKREVGECIIRSSSFKQSKGKNHWLGEGIYFFEEDSGQARDFILKARGIKNYLIIQADIQSDSMLDLVHKDTYTVLREIGKTFLKKVAEIKGTEHTNNINDTDLNCLVLSAAYQLYPYEVVRGVFLVPKMGRIDGTNILPVQIQVCVKNPKTIKNIKESV